MNLTTNQQQQIMHHSAQSLPNAPTSFLSLSVSAALSQHHAVPLLFSRDNIPPGSPLARTLTYRSSWQGLVHPCPPSPTSSQQHSGIHSTASQQSDVVLHPKGSHLSAPLYNKQQGMQILHCGVKIE